MSALLQPAALATFAIGVVVGVATCLAFLSIEHSNRKDLP